MDHQSDYNFFYRGRWMFHANPSHSWWPNSLKSQMSEVFAQEQLMSELKLVPTNPVNVEMCDWISKYSICQWCNKKSPKSLGPAKKIRRGPSNTCWDILVSDQLTSIAVHRAIVLVAWPKTTKGTSQIWKHIIQMYKKILHFNISPLSQEIFSDRLTESFMSNIAGHLTPAVYLRHFSWVHLPSTCQLESAQSFSVSALWAKRESLGSGAHYNQVRDSHKHPRTC